MLETWLPLLAIAALGAWWYHALRARERATAIARELCANHGLQLLDDSVALHRLRVNLRGGLAVTREYRFEVSLGANDRRTASVTLRDARVIASSVPSSDPPAHAGPGLEAPRWNAPGTPPAPPGDNVVPIERARRTLH